MGISPPARKLASCPLMAIRLGSARSRTSRPLVREVPEGTTSNLVLPGCLPDPEQQVGQGADARGGSAARQCASRRIAGEDVQTAGECAVGGEGIESDRLALQVAGDFRETHLQDHLLVRRRLQAGSPPPQASTPERVFPSAGRSAGLERVREESRRCPRRLHRSTGQGSSWRTDPATNREVGGDQHFDGLRMICASSQRMIWVGMPDFLPRTSISEGPTRLTSAISGEATLTRRSSTLVQHHALIYCEPQTTLSVEPVGHQRIAGLLRCDRRASAAAVAQSRAASRPARARGPTKSHPGARVCCCS